jgi:CDP-glycerol glycerophosphotransferase (TagB/SpsB family)
MPRFDNLYNTKSEEENMITFMPTWRSTLCGPIIPRSLSREYNSEFTKSEYYKFYYGLCTDKRLTDCLKKNKCKVLFCVHPAFVRQLKDFKDTEYVTFKAEVYYPEVFKKAKLMLTDYSSVAFDFGYTHKPLVYTFFDKDHLFQIHTVITNDGEFDFEKDGFGPVEYDYESTLKALIKIIDSGFKNDKKYIDRVNKYFKYHDDKNCERVYNETLKMLERTK